MRIDKNNLPTDLVRKLKSVGFVIANFPGLFEFGRIRIPKTFNELHGSMIQNDIILITNNGDRWVCSYDQISCQITGVGKFMNFYGVALYWFMVLTYRGNGEFDVNIFSPKYSEIIYFKASHNDTKIEEKEAVNLEVPLNPFTTEELDGASLFFNVSWSDFHFFKLVILPVHLNGLYDKVPVSVKLYHIYKNWSNGERITVWLFNRCWKIEIEWCNYYFMFGRGWRKFVIETYIRLGDTCIFECTGNRYEFNICKERHEVHDFIIANSDLRGMLPISLGNSFGNLLLKVVEFVMPSNQSWSICFRENPSSFIFTKEFAPYYGLKENFVIVFEYLGHSRFFVRIFDQKSVEISYLNLRKTSKRDDVFWGSKYIFGFAKGNLIDFTGLRNMKGIVKKYLKMVDKACVGHKLTLLEKDKNFFGRFVIVLRCSSIDHKLYNVYIGNFMISFLKDWSNGLVSRLIAHKRHWRVVISLQPDMCKLGRGWEKFARDNDLSGGDLCIFTLLNCVRKIFRVDIIRM
ncbi:uncharacterized protein LOC141680050 [Apium graveolens]|uniref:uncharacterized protein LOC141680050 n=1 Tax=Apium graveolens TaxID=4045 RepID=UPI003D7A1146